jgi:hypothetical protein
MRARARISSPRRAPAVAFALGLLGLLVVGARGTAHAAPSPGCDTATLPLFIVGGVPGLGAAIAHGVYLGKGERPPEPVNTLAYFAAALNLATAITPVTSFFACDDHQRSIFYGGGNIVFAVMDVGLAMWSSRMPPLVRRREVALLPFADPRPGHKRAGATLALRF